MGVVSAMNGVYYECGFEVSITASSTQTEEACYEQAYPLGAQRDCMGSNHHVLEAQSLLVLLFKTPYSFLDAWWAGQLGWSLSRQSSLTIFLEDSWAGLDSARPYLCQLKALHCTLQLVLVT